MHITHPLNRSKLILSIGVCLIFLLIKAVNADSTAALPAVIQSGLTLYASGGPDVAVSAWEKAGPLERDKKTEAYADEFKQLEKSLGHYKSFELIETKDIGKISKVFYLSMCFERGAVFASFQVYKTSKDWVVQNMDFNTKPEAIMQWLALSGGK